ncbi:hypothetical protein [Ancylomarina sp.]|uniref:hypothetical protein n=1 Tax=Ancylomarina sp. TaxID=1970196 RepID=UPI00356684A9
MASIYRINTIAHTIGTAGGYYLLETISSIIGKYYEFLGAYKLPFVIMYGYITKLFSKESNYPSVSHEEISIMSDIGTVVGVFKDNENKVIHELVR